MTAVVANELIELSFDLARAVSEHDVGSLEDLLAAEFTLQGAAGQLDLTDSATGRAHTIRPLPTRQARRRAGSALASRHLPDQR